MKINSWRLIEPLALGTFANYIINYLFSSGDPEFSSIEWIVAVILCTIITEINRIIELKLDKKLKWIGNAKKRFFYNLLYLSLTMFFVINAIGNLYLIAKGDNFYEWNELITINLVTFCIGLILTSFRWALQFFYNWRSVERSLQVSDSRLKNLISDVIQSETFMSVKKNKKEFMIQLNSIRLIKCHYGVTKITDHQGDTYISDESLKSIIPKLPEHLFFLTNRSTIVHRESIVSISSDSYGKMELEVRDKNEEFVRINVSRLKASNFRLWYKDISRIKT